MHARVTTLKGSPEGVDKAFSFVDDTVRPGAQDQQGFKGIVNLASRVTGVVISIAFWESEDDLKASEEFAEEMRSEGPKEFDAEVVSVERYEARVSGGQLTLE